MTTEQFNQQVKQKIDNLYGGGYINRDQWIQLRIAFYQAVLNSTHAVASLNTLINDISSDSGL